VPFIFIAVAQKTLSMQAGVSPIRETSRFIHLGEIKTGRKEKILIYPVKTVVTGKIRTNFLE
jgi:hypothetical protein